jgi:hypothetical protein
VIAVPQHAPADPDGGQLCSPPVQDHGAGLIGSPLAGSIGRGALSSVGSPSGDAEFLRDGGVGVVGRIGQLVSPRGGLALCGVELDASGAEPLDVVP